MQPEQDTTPTFNEMLRMGIRANEIGMPQEWSSLIHKPIKRDLECTARLLAGIDKPKAQDYIVQLAKRDLSYVAAFFNSLRVPFFFFGWDRPRSAIVQCCGPDRMSVLDLLNHQPVTQQPTAGPSNDRLNRVWQAVGIVLDELWFRDGISFSLAWNPHYGRIPEFDFTGHDRQVAWNALWQSLPLVDRGRVSREPPRLPTAVEVQRIEPASPSRWEPDAPGIEWHEFQKHNFDCPLDWRWCRAFALVRNGRDFNPKWDDEETGLTVEFLKALLQSPQDLQSLAERMPDLVAAHEMRAGPVDPRLELESRLLARQSSEVIAQRLLISPAAVDAYHNTYFDVRQRLDARMYIRMKVIGTHGGLAVDNQTPEILLKSVAFLGGPACLDACLPYLRNGGQQLALRTATDEIPVHDPLAERLDLLLRAQSMPADGKTSASLVRAAADLISDFPEYRPPQRWAGVFAQIVSPFEGEITSSAVELKAEESADRQAA